MEPLNDIFISHQSKDNELALELYNLLKAIDPQLQVFLDCLDTRPLEQHDEWRARMLKEVENSRHLIFLASDTEYLKEGNGWLYEEVSLFQNRKATRNRRGAGDRNLSYFGILACPVNFEKDLFSDPIRGSEYRTLYDRPEHILLNGSLLDARERIRAKVQTLMTGSAFTFAAEVLDRTRSFAESRAKLDPMFREEAISEHLLPVLSDSKNNLYSFPDLCDTLLESHMAILGHAGGGKTTLLTKLFFHHLRYADPLDHATMIPLYIDGKNLFGPNLLILRQLAKLLYGKNLAQFGDEITAEGILDREFSRNDGTPQYLLLIDGYNEIPASHIATFRREFAEFLPGGRYTNVRLVLSGRYIDNLFPEEDFPLLQLGNLTNSAIAEYLKTRNLWRGTLNATLFTLLSIPMYLKLYADTAADDRVQTKGDLLCQFVSWQLKKDQQTALTDKKRAQHRIFFLHLFPYLSYRMAAAGDTTLVMTEDDLQDMVADGMALISRTDYKRYFGADFRAELRSCEFDRLDELDIADLFTEYCVQNCKLLRRKDNETLDFTHQIYRDFFCAWYVTDALRRSIQNRSGCESLSSPLNTDVREFTADILKEGRPFFDRALQRWNYRCNENSVLFALPQLLRDGGQAEDAAAVFNAVELLKYARGGDLTGCDFSNLDLRQCSLVGCTLYRRDEAGAYAASFRGARLDRENLLPDFHYSELRALCIQGERYICADADGTIKIWKPNGASGNMEAELTHAPRDIQKLLLSPDGAGLYAMTEFCVYFIALESAGSHRAQPRLVLQSTKELRDIFYDDGGQLCFTTVFNAFNPKPVTAPDLPDIRNFYGLNSAAAIRWDGQQIAVGHIAGYSTLKLYAPCPETGEWQEQKFGYSKILDHYISQLEDFLRQEGLYGLFPDDFHGTAPRASYFLHLQTQFEDRGHNYTKMPLKILERIDKVLDRKGLWFSPSQKEQLAAMADECVEQILLLQKENPALLMLAGKQIQQVCYRPGGDELLISLYYVDKGSMFSFVVEMDTRTLQTRYLTSFIGSNPLRATYDSDRIVVCSSYRISIFDRNRQMQFSIAARPNMVRCLLSSRKEGEFFVLSDHYIYRFNARLQCLDCWDNQFETFNLCCGMDESGAELLSWRSSFREDREEEAVVMNTATGAFYKTSEQLTLHSRQDQLLEMGEFRVKFSGNVLTAFTGNNLTGRLTMCYKLFACGCDFTGITGTLAQPLQLQRLNRFGAVTDPIAPPPAVALPPLPEFEVSGQPFAHAETDPLSPFCVRAGGMLDRRNLSKFPIGHSNSANFLRLKGWNQIHWDSFSKNTLEEADFALLSWVNRLGFLTAELLTELIESGVVGQPGWYTGDPQQVRDRMELVLHKRFQLLERYAHLRTDGSEEEPLYCASAEFGEKLLHWAAHDPIFRTKAYYRERLPYGPVLRLIAVNDWFCLTLRQHRPLLNRYHISTILDSDLYFSGKARIPCCMVLKDQPFFAEACPQLSDEFVRADTEGKILRTCLLASAYNRLTLPDGTVESMVRPPILVLIGENYHHCLQLQALAGGILPQIRKLYTCHSLLHGEGGSRYLEFADGTPRQVTLEDLLGAAQPV